MPAEETVSTVIVLVGGEAPRPLPSLPSPDLVIAADSGLALAAPLGLDSDLVIGDMDSVSPALLAAAETAGVAVERYPADKGATDLELALDAAMARAASSIVVVGGGGGRLDHLLASAALLASERYGAASVRWFVDGYHVAVVRRRHRIDGTIGDQVTLLAVGGVAVVTTSGLRWGLDAQPLEPGSTRGVSNELQSTSATVTVDAGCVIVLHRL
jgi:thiamine pyrophosphokinase